VTEIDDEREALYEAVSGAVHAEGIYEGHPAKNTIRMELTQAVTDSVERAGFRRQGPITDAQVDRAAEAFAIAEHGDSADQQDADYYAPKIRAAIEAARDAS
jgi:hypothetical protein